MKKLLIKSALTGYLVCIELLSFGQSIIAGSQTTVLSPDRNLSVQFYQRQDIDKKRTMYYQVTYKGKAVIRESALGLNMDNQLSEKAMALKIDRHKDWCENLEVKQVSTTAHDSSWVPVNGERSLIRDCYNAATIEMVKDDNPIYTFNVEMRAYNEGIAFRYFLPENQKGTYYNIIAENTEFSLPEESTAWFANWAQAPYSKLPLYNWTGESERPLTLELKNGLYVCLAEAQMVDYTRTKFKLSDHKPNTVVTSLFPGGAELISPIGTPWRVIMVAERPGALIENDDIIQNLNESRKIARTDWIKPGKIMRVMNQSTADARANIDFAVQQGLQYILFDWKWYGPAFSFGSDATKVAITDFDLPGIISYGREKGIGVWLYVNQQAALTQSDSLFSVYEKWGVKGVKIGFVQVGSHRWTTWVEDVIHKAAAHHIMINIHDDWRPTGEQRTWPNLMTAEGIRGNEEMPDATHNTILPFTRYLAGPADYTICYFDKRIKTTHAHQLALAAIFYSPLQTLFWYDQPSAFHNEPELAFWKAIPTTWDETKVIQGVPGQYITIARRKGNEWFLGTITNNDPRSLRLSFGFLPRGKKYMASIYSDDQNVRSSTGVKIQKIKIDATTTLTVALTGSGGQAIHLTPVR
ncbi:glycoside hydrolase family 97 N-terminal domain-containing protein [Mucilaginibacter sp.]|uniref:glycoside hydrolase family 97 protein n=1 Tax=Mucilaginibacter sp. TaxID=1882438 RepID=UPI003563A18A